MNIYRSDQAWFRCPTCKAYYIYEGEVPNGRVVYKTHKNPRPSQCDDTGKCIDKRPFYKTVTYAPCPAHRNPAVHENPCVKCSDLFNWESAANAGLAGFSSHPCIACANNPGGYE
jgi:hypothetical protein